MTDIKINEPGEVEIPAWTPKKKLVSKYPFASLEIGASFDIPAAEMTKRNADVLVSRWGPKCNAVFRYAPVTDESGNVGIVRFWRES